MENKSYQGKYYKLKDNQLTFNEARNYWKERIDHKDKNFILTNDNYKVLSPYEIDNIDEVKLNYIEFNSQWSFWVIDNEKQGKLDDIYDYMNDIDFGRKIDSRFYDLYKMDISDIWTQLDHLFILSDDLKYEILMWCKENNKINIE